MMDDDDEEEDSMMLLMGIRDSARTVVPMKEQSALCVLCLFRSSVVFSSSEQSVSLLAQSILLERSSCSVCFIKRYTAVILCFFLLPRRDRQRGEKIPAPHKRRLPKKTNAKTNTPRVIICQ